MRIRRKKHLKERLETVKDYLIVPERDIVNVTEAVKDKKYLNFKIIFGNDNPVEMEIGCGKGGFIVQKAIDNPNVNYIAVEMLENIIVMAAERAKNLSLKNLVFMNSGAEYLPRYIPDDSISNLYLNFSPPYPQNGYESRRLTCARNVINYKNFIVKGGKVFQKTDDRPFFEYSFEKFNECGFEVVEISKDIDDGKIENVMTEYEKKFRSQNIPINALIAKNTK